MFSSGLNTDFEATGEQPFIKMTSANNLTAFGSIFRYLNSRYENVSMEISKSENVELFILNDDRLVK